MSENGGPFRAVAGDRHLAAGDRTRLSDGGAVLEMVRGLEIELRSGSDITVDLAPVLHSGEALVRTDDASSRVMASADSAAVIAPDSVVRLTRSLAYGASAYRGRVELHSVGRSIDVPTFRHATIAAVGAVSREPLPILVDDTDVWDRRYLGAAIELTRQLDAVSSGFTANVVTSIRPVPDLVLTAVPGAVATREFDAVASGQRRPGELLVGTAIATAAKASVTPVFDFRDQGATWGLVALDQAIRDADSLFGLLRLALDGAPLLATSVAAPAPAATSTELARGDSTPPPAPDSTPESPSEDPAEPERTSPIESVEEVVEDTTEAIIEESEPLTDFVTDSTEVLLDAADETTSDSTVSDPTGTPIEDTTGTVTGGL